MMNPFDLIDPFLVELTSLKGPKLLIAVLIMLGYVLKVSRFPNTHIPKVTLTIGPLLTPFLVAWPNTENAPPEVLWPVITAWVQTLSMGVLLSALAWLLHNKVLSKWIDKPMNGVNGNGHSAPPAPP